MNEENQTVVNLSNASESVKLIPKESTKESKSPLYTLQLRFVELILTILCLVLLILNASSGHYHYKLDLILFTIIFSLIYYTFLILEQLHPSVHKTFSIVVPRVKSILTFAFDLLSFLFWISTIEALFRVYPSVGVILNGINSILITIFAGSSLSISLAAAHPQFSLIAFLSNLPLKGEIQPFPLYMMLVRIIETAIPLLTLFIISISSYRYYGDVGYSVVSVLSEIYTLFLLAEYYVVSIKEAFSNIAPNLKYLVNTIVNLLFTITWVITSIVMFQFSNTERCLQGYRYPNGTFIEILPGYRNDYGYNGNFDSNYYNPRGGYVYQFEEHCSGLGHYLRFAPGVLSIVNSICFLVSFCYSFWLLIPFFEPLRVYFEKLLLKWEIIKYD